MLTKTLPRVYHRLLAYIGGISLRSAIILAVFFGLMGSAAILIPLNTNSIETSARERQNQDHLRLANILAVIQSEPLWQITPDIARVSSNVVYSDPRIASIEVFSFPDHKQFI